MNNGFIYYRKCPTCGHVEEIREQSQPEIIPQVQHVQQPPRGPNQLNPNLPLHAPRPQGKPPAPLSRESFNESGGGVSAGFGK